MVTLGRWVLSEKALAAEMVQVCPLTAPLRAQLCNIRLKMEEEKEMFPCSQWRAAQWIFPEINCSLWRAHNGAGGKCEEGVVRRNCCALTTIPLCCLREVRNEGVKLSLGNAESMWKKYVVFSFFFPH